MKDENGRSYRVADIHIDSIRAGDTVLIDGVMKTVCAKDITTGGFMGTTLFGDSYRLGTLPVQRATFVALA